MKKILFVYITAIFYFYTYQASAHKGGIAALSEKSGVAQNNNPHIEISAYPNPFKDIVNLEITANNCKPTSLKVYDIIGVERDQIDLTHFYIQNSYKVVLKDLPAGVYFCNIYSDKILLDSKKIICSK